jgi:alginate O-acetyltransferase complex protein AlgI
MVAWVFFRADNLGDAFDYLAAMIGLSGRSADGYILVYLDTQTLVALIVGVVLVFLPKLTTITEPAADAEPRDNPWLAGAIRDGALVAAFFLSVVYVSAQSYNPFIYFRF